MNKASTVIDEMNALVTDQQNQLLKVFGHNKLPRNELKEQEYLRAIAHWTSKIHEAEHHIEQNRKKIEAL